MTDSGEKEETLGLPLLTAITCTKKKLIWENFTRELLSASVVFERIMPEYVLHWLCLLCSGMHNAMHKWPVVYSTNIRYEKLKHNIFPVLWLFSAVYVGTEAGTFKGVSQNDIPCSQ